MVADTVVDLALGLTVLLVPIGLLVSALILIVRLAARGDLARGLGYVLLLPTRRTTLLRLATATVALFLVAGVANGLTLLGILLEAPSDLLIAGSDLSASILLFLFLFKGLASTHLSEPERVAMARASTSLAALGIIKSLQEPDS